MLSRIDVSPEMVMLHGQGRVPEGAYPENAQAFLYDFAEGSFHCTAFAPADLDADDGKSRVVLIVARAACERLRGQASILREMRTYHMPATLRAIVAAVRECDLPDGVEQIYRGAKSLELLCETMRLDLDDILLPHGQGAGLTVADSERLLAARRVIEERWSEKLTIEGIARLCGLNRGKLTRGYRDLFDCSIADAIAEQRLGHAGNMLVVTDLPISSIGYRCGYLNNASFTRAFARHFGVAPTRYRAARLAA